MQILKWRVGAHGCCHIHRRNVIDFAQDGTWSHVLAPVKNLHHDTVDMCWSFRSSTSYAKFEPAPSHVAVATCKLIAGICDLASSLHARHPGLVVTCCSTFEDQLRQLRHESILECWNAPWPDVALQQVGDLDEAVQWLFPVPL